MRLYLRIWRGPDDSLQYKEIDAKEVIVKDGVTIKSDDGDVNTYLVVVSDGIFHHVYDLWVT